MQGGAGEASLSLSPSQLCVTNRRGAENCNPSAAGYYCRCMVKRPSSRRKSLPSQSPDRQPMPAHCKVAFSWHKADITMPHVSGNHDVQCSPGKKARTTAAISAAARLARPAQSFMKAIAQMCIAR